MASLYHITKNIIKKKSRKTMTWKLVPRPFEFAKNQAQTLLENETWKWKQTTYVLAKLSKFVQISTQTSSDFFLQDSLKIKKDLELVSRRYFPCTFLIKFFFCHVTWTSQISSPDWVYFPSYLAKCVSCFMLRHLMTSWHLNIWKVKS